MKKFAVSMILAGSLGLAACSGSNEPTEVEDVNVDATDAAPTDMATDAVAGAESDADAMGEMNADAMNEGTMTDGASPMETAPVADATTAAE